MSLLMLGVGGSKTTARRDAAAEARRKAEEAEAAAPRSELLLQTILTFGPDVPEGRVVEAVALPWFEIYDQIERDPDFLYRFPQHPHKFEEFIAGALEHDGYKVTLTPKSGDGGRDIIAVKEGFGGVRFLEQTKAYSPGTLVTHDHVRSMIGVLLSDHNATKGFITTTSTFQPNVFEAEEIKKHMPHRLELKDGTKLREWLKQIRDKAGSQQ